MYEASSGLITEAGWVSVPDDFLKGETGYLICIVEFLQAKEYITSALLVLLVCISDTFYRQCKHKNPSY